MQDNVRRKCIFHPYLTIQSHRHVGHQNSSHDHASLDSYFEEEPVVVGDAPQQRVEPFVSVIYWTYHIKQVLNYKIRQQGKASNHSIFSSVCLPRAQKPCAQPGHTNPKNGGVHYSPLPPPTPPP